MLTKREKFVALAMLVVGIVIAGLVLGPDIIGGMTYSRFRPVYFYPSFDRGGEILDLPIPATHRRKLMRTLADDDVPYEMRDGVLYVRNREWWDEFRMAIITERADLPVETEDLDSETELFPLYPERSVLAETALFREQPVERGIKALRCVFSHYGLDTASGTGHLRVPGKILDNAAFLRFAAARAGDSEWLAARRARDRLCKPDYWELAFTGYGTAAPGQPWPQYGSDELAEILNEHGFIRRIDQAYPDAPPSVAQGLSDEPEVLELIVSQAADEAPVWPDEVRGGPSQLFDFLRPEYTILVETPLFRERPSGEPLADLLCVFRFYGVLLYHGKDGVEAPRHVFRNDRFLRVAAARASDAEWLDRVRARHRLCWSGLETVTFEADSGRAADSPWPGYSRSELADTLARIGIAHRRPADGALKVPASLYREPEILALLAYGYSEADGVAALARDAVESMFDELLGDAMKGRDRYFEWGPAE